MVSILSKLLDLYAGGIEIDRQLLARVYYGNAKSLIVGISEPKEFAQTIYYCEEAIRLDPKNQDMKDYFKDFLISTGIEPVIRARRPTFLRGKGRDGPS